MNIPSPVLRDYDIVTFYIVFNDPKLLASLDANASGFRYTNNELRMGLYK